VQDKKMRVLLLLYCIWSSLALSAQARSDVDPATFKKLVDSGNYTVVDLRTPAEIARHGKIKDAVELDYLRNDADSLVNRLPRDAKYLVYCAGGGRSADCAAKMRELNFDEVINLEKGFDEWRKRNYPIEKSGTK
jgi:phage shock protein E